MTKTLLAHYATDVEQMLIIKDFHRRERDAGVEPPPRRELDCNENHASADTQEPVAAACEKWLVFVDIQNTMWSSVLGG
jgi:hypothetical protein